MPNFSAVSNALANECHLEPEEEPETEEEGVLFSSASSLRYSRPPAQPATECS